MNGPAPNLDPNLNHRIDRALQTLTQAQPSPDLEDRLLCALRQSHQPNPNRLTSFIGRRIHLRKPALLVTTALLLAFLLIPHHPNPGAPSSPAMSQGPKLAAPLPRRGSPPVKVGPPPPMSAQASLSATAPPQPWPNTPIHLTLTASPATAPDLSPDLSSDPDQQALADLHAPSQPAPPLPPTPQERLVLLMLRRNERQNLAQLQPAEPSALFQQELNAFHNYFHVPLPADPTPSQPTEESPDPVALPPSPTQPPPPDLFTKHEGAPQ